MRAPVPIHKRTWTPTKIASHLWILLPSTCRRSFSDGVANRCYLFESRNQLRGARDEERSEEHTSELQSLMRISYAVFCLKKKKTIRHITTYTQEQTKQNDRLIN